MSLTKEDLIDVGKELALMMREKIRQELDPLVARIAELESSKALDSVRLKALEDRPSLVYKGTWNDRESYGVGDVTTWAGSAWHAEKASSGRRPGDSPDAWRLMVKKGTDSSR